MLKILAEMDSSAHWGSVNVLDSVLFHHYLIHLDGIWVTLLDPPAVVCQNLPVHSHPLESQNARLKKDLKDNFVPSCT